MKTKKENRKLEFKKETIARLGESYLRGVYGVSGGLNISWNENNLCTQGLRTRIARDSCIGNCHDTV